MSGYWDSYGNIQPRRLCDICHQYGHWSYECDFSPPRWEDPYFSGGYDGNRGAVYDHSFQQWESSQPYYDQDMQHEGSIHEKLDKMLELLRDMKENREMMEETRQGRKEYTKWFDQQMDEFHAPLKEIGEDEGMLYSQVQGSSESDSLCLPKQSPLEDEQLLEHDGNILYLPKQSPTAEPLMPIYTEQDYALEFDDFSNIDETDSLDQEHVETILTHDCLEMDAKSELDGFDEVESGDNEIEEVVKCFVEEEVSSMVFGEFYHLPFKIEDASGRFKKKMTMQSCKCEEIERSQILGFGDDRMIVPEIITWYKDRGKFSPKNLH